MDRFLSMMLLVGQELSKPQLIGYMFGNHMSPLFVTLTPDSEDWRHPGYTIAYEIEYRRGRAYQSPREAYTLGSGKKHELITNGFVNLDENTFMALIPIDFGRQRLIEGIDAG